MSSLELLLLLLLAGKEEVKGESAGSGGAAGEPRVHPRPVVRGQRSNREGRGVRSLRVAFSGFYRAPRLRREGLSGATMLLLGCHQAKSFIISSAPPHLL